MACKFIKKETLGQVFFCEYCEILKNTNFYRTPLVARSFWKNKNNKFKIPNVYGHNNSDWKWVYHTLFFSNSHNKDKNLFLNPKMCFAREMFSSSPLLSAKTKLASSAPLIFEKLETIKVELWLQYIQ